MDISKLDKAEVLMVLYNNAKPLGMSYLHYDPAPMTKEEAQKILDTGQDYFDYLKGRVMKISLKRNDLDTRLYNRDNGENAAENALYPILTKDL